MSKKGRVEYVRGKKPRYFVDGREVSAQEYDKAFPSKLQQLLEAKELLPANLQTAWPLISDAFAVHPDQVAEATLRNKKAGVNVGYKKNGQAEIPSRHERRKLSILEGCHDKDGGYGD